ncbi:FAD-dependent oxidoreductase [Caldimonas tepidiphila]|uniref:FAD-dependent oxidoreductase n=1 Tax=Caldimonas tepidiphila TaxID=2315841 RepID=UPI000E5C095C|nr:FAD-dependent oxidoreductase [Caldimonas tepidiphila]
MRIAVIGAGIVGVTTAYELAADGHQPVVFERRNSVAAENSFANAGIVAPGYVAPWAAPGMPRRLLAQMLARHAAWRLRPGADPGAWRWLWRWWRACQPARYQEQRSAMHRLAAYSQQRLHEIRRLHRLDYERSEGYLVLLRGERDVALAMPGLELLRQMEVPAQLLDPQHCREREPHLHPDTPLSAGIAVPGDEVGNCRQFAHLLREEAQRLGARFEFGTEALAIDPDTRPILLLEARGAGSGGPGLGGPAEAVAPKRRREQFDAVVVCAAVPSLKLLEPLGMGLPLMPVHGYSLSAALRNHERGPLSAVMDERYKVVISRQGSRVRVAGGAELGGAPERHSQAVLATLYKVLHDWFPGAAQLQQVQVWKGARPMLPDGPPVIGASGAPGVWLNLGHGASGWALACGSARLLADQLNRRSPAIDAGAFLAARFARR